MLRGALWALYGCWLWLAPLYARADEPAALRRFAILIAANDGGPERAPLKHALSDTRAVGAVLGELGGIQERDTTLLVQPDVATVRATLARLNEGFRALTAAHTRAELLLYYSGHSDEYGLLLGGERLPYQELRELLKGLTVDVRVAILDSCASGAFTREKGGRPRAPFMLDTSSAVRGHAFLTSSSEDEAAQESDSLGGSFFTHFLVSGLRGAADSSGDGKVTLTEAYRYAFDETLANTGRTRFGAQHPAYDMRLAGTGDLVLTDLRSTASELTLDESVAGRVFVRDEFGRVLVELSKSPGKRITLGLPPGSYSLELAHGTGLARASVATQRVQPTRVGAAQFRRVERIYTSARGAIYRRAPAAAALVARLSTNRLLGTDDVLNHFAFALVYDRPAAVAGLQLSLAGAWARDWLAGVQLAPVFAATHALSGVQLSSVSYSAGLARGLMLGAVTALAGGHMVGLQAAPLTWARSLHGLQLGAVNVAERVSGVQLGAVNIVTSELRGVALGLFNYAEKADVSLAPVAITRQGGAHAQLSISDTSMLNLALRLDATYNYSFVSVGVHSSAADARRGYSIGAGLGAKLPLWERTLWLDIDLSLHIVQPYKHWHTGVPNSLSQLRLLLRYELHRHFSVFAGPTLNVLLQTDRERRQDLGFGLRRYTLTDADASARVALWPGFAAGFRF